MRRGSRIHGRGFRNASSSARKHATAAWSARTTLAAANRVLVWNQPASPARPASVDALGGRSVKTGCVPSSAN